MRECTDWGAASILVLRREEEEGDRRSSTESRGSSAPCTRAQPSGDLQTQVSLGYCEARQHQGSEVKVPPLHGDPRNLNRVSSVAVGGVKSCCEKTYVCALRKKLYGG